MQDNQDGRENLLRPASSTSLRPDYIKNVFKLETQWSAMKLMSIFPQLKEINFFHNSCDLMERSMKFSFYTSLSFFITIYMNF